MSHRDNLIASEERAIAQRKALANWQLKAAYFLAMVNNQAVKEGQTVVTIQLTPGQTPELRKVTKE